MTRLGGIELDEFRVGFRGRTARLAMPEGVALSRSRLDAALVEAATACRGAVPGRNACRCRRKSRRNATGAADPSRAVRSRSPPASCWSPPAWGVCAWRTTRWRRRKFGPARGSARVAWSTMHPVSTHERTIFMAVGREGYVGAVRVEDGSLNVAAAFEPALVRRWGTPGLAAAAILAEAGFPPIAGLENAHWQGTAGLTRQTRPLAEERLFLLGDAAGYVEPFTGEGIAWALASGQAVAPLALQAMERWDPRDRPGLVEPSSAPDRPPATSSVARSRSGCASPGWLRSGSRS